MYLYVDMTGNMERELGTRGLNDSSNEDSCF